MLSNKPDNIEKSKDTLARFNHWDERNEKETYRLGIIAFGLLGIPALPISVFILVANDLVAVDTEYYKILLFVPVAIFAVLIHELIHYVFQWVFSKKIPELRYKKPFPYSKLRENSSISRNQGIVSALSPLIIITVGCVLFAIIVSPITQVILILTAWTHSLSCGGDIMSTNRLLKYPKDTRSRVEGCEVVYFRELNVE